MSEQRSQSNTKPYVTTTHGMRGHYAVLLSWNNEHGGFYEPWQTSPASFPTKEEAQEDAKNWASAENVEYRP